MEGASSWTARRDNGFGKEYIHCPIWIKSNAKQQITMDKIQYERFANSLSSEERAKQKELLMMLDQDTYGILELVSLWEEVRMKLAILLTKE